LAKGSKALKASLVRLGEIPIFLPVGMSGGGIVKAGTLLKNIAGRAHRRALEKALAALPVPILREAGKSLHHIVAWDDRRAKGARELLDKFKINIDEAINGVFLPATLKSPNPKGAMVHSTLHTDDYYLTVERYLQKAKSRDDAIRRLTKIRETLLDGTFHHAIK
jgi:hypothetical protein